MQKTKRLSIWLFSFVFALCLAIGLVFLRPAFVPAVAETAQKEIGRYVQVTSTESTSTSIFLQNGYQILPPGAATGATDAPAYVMHVPTDIEGTATITSTGVKDTYIKQTSNYQRDLRFRVIHYKASENMSRVVYPLNGGWQSYSYSYTYFMNESGLQSITVGAGDKLYFVMNAFASGGYRDTHLKLSLNITYGDTTSVWSNTSETTTCAHTGVFAADATETTDAFYGGTYTYGELLTYELATVTDLVKDSVEISATGFTEDFTVSATPTYATENETPYAASPSSWSQMVYKTPLTDYRVDLAFRWNGVDNNSDFGIYFNCDNSAATQNGHVLHFYQGSALLYNSTAITSWWTNYDKMVVREYTSYRDSEWHTLSLNVWQNKYFITIDGRFLAEDLLSFGTNAVSDPHYGDHVYTADSVWKNTYLRFVGTGFDIKQFDVTWFDYSDSVAEAQFAAAQSVHAAMGELNKEDYEERSWAVVESTLQSGVAQIFNASDADTVNALAEEIGAQLKEIPFSLNEILIGYSITGTGYEGVYGVDTPLDGENVDSATPVYVRLEMDEGASIRLTEPTGMRFTMKMEKEYVEKLDGLGVSYSMGMLIAHSDDILTEGAVDYSLLTPTSSITKLDIPMTVSAEEGNYKLFNGVLVEIKQHHYDWDFVGRGYIKINYADGSEAVFYAEPSDNARSVKQVALLAYNDLQAEKDDEYCNETEYGYSPYTQAERKVLELFINDGEEFIVKTNPDVGTTSLHVLDVSNVPEDDLFGAAHSVLIQHNDQVILIDGGFNYENSKARIINYLKAEGVERIDYMILTHSHSDHAGGLPDIINAFDVGTLYMKPVDWEMANMTADNYELVYNAAINKINSNGLKVNIVEPTTEGQRVTLDETTYFEIYNCTTLFENQYDGQDYNHFSHQILFASDTAKAHIGGDATTSSDEHVLGNLGKVDVYVMQHHGDQTYYSSEALLAELQPTYSIATGNAEVPRAVSRATCEKYGQVMNTGTDGTLVFDKTDGKFVIRERGEDYLANAQKVNIVSTPVPSVSGATSLTTADGNKFFQYGLSLKGGATTSTAVVLNVPQSFPSTATLTFTKSLIYNTSGAGKQVRLRIVLNDKVVYPSEGGWVDLTNADTDNRHYIDLRVKVKAGDKLYYIVDGEATVYATMGMRIDGLWFDLTNVDHLSSDNNAVAATKNFFNGSLYNGAIYTRAELISYEQVVVTDAAAADSSDIEAEIASIEAVIKKENYSEE